MIDNFVLALTHGLMLVAAWRILSRPDLQDDAVPPPDGSSAASGWATARRSTKADTPRA